MIVEPTTAVFTAEEILEICSGRLASGMLPDEAGAISVDTRELREGEWFLALPGRRFDGHDFLGDAFSSGALGAVVVERVGYAVSNPQFTLLAVEDTGLAYQSLSFNWRRRINPKVALVAGSAGRRIASSCADMFGAWRRFYYGNERNPFSALLSMPYDTQIAMIEISLVELLRCDRLIEFMRPDLLIMADPEEFELSSFGSADAVAIAQVKLLSKLDSGKCNVISVQTRDASTGKTKDIVEMVVSAARYLGLNDTEISQGLNHFQSGDKMS